MDSYAAAVGIFAVLVAIIVGALWGPILLRRERPSAAHFRSGGCCDRRCGRCAQCARAHRGTTASAVAYMAERSA